MARLEGAAGLNRSEEAFRTVALLQLLLARFPGDMAPPFQADTLAFFRTLLLPALVELQCAPRVRVRVALPRSLCLHSDRTTCESPSPRGVCVTHRYVGIR